MKILLALLTSASALAAQQAWCDPWYDQRLEGWYYFQEPSAEEEPLLLPEEAEEILQTEKQRLKELLSLALLFPSENHIEQYMRAQKRWIDQSAHFADVWGKILLEKPDLDTTLDHPMTSYGIAAKQSIEAKRRNDLLDSLSKTHFLLFCFNGQDPYSESAAKTAKLFAASHGWKLKSLSLDGTGLPILEDFEIDKGIGKNLNLHSAPSFYAVDPVENIAVSLGAGLISASDIERNIESQFGFRND